MPPLCFESDDWSGPAPADWSDEDVDAEDVRRLWKSVIWCFSVIGSKLTIFNGSLILVDGFCLLSLALVARSVFKELR